MRAAVIQFHPRQGETETNLTRAGALLAEAAAAGAEVVVLPELFGTGLPRPGEQPAELAEPTDGRIASWVVDQAARLGVAVAGTFLEVTELEVRNRLVLVEAAGQVHLYAKRKLDRLERGLLAPGSEAPVVDTSLGPVGLLVCLDAADPELVAQIRSARVRAIVYPHATLATRWAARLVWAYESRRRPLIASLAERGGAPVLAAGQLGPCRIRPGWAGNYMRGSTFIVGTDRRVLARTGAGIEGVAIAEWTTATGSHSVSRDRVATGPSPSSQPGTRRGAMLLIVTDDGRLLLHHRDDKPGIPHPGCWAGFGGAVEEGEDVATALRREVLEETGLEVHNAIPLVDAVDVEGDGRLVSLYYVVGGIEPDDIALSEGAGIGVHSFEDLGRLKVTPFVRRAVEQELLPLITEGRHKS